MPHTITPLPPTQEHILVSAKVFKTPGEVMAVIVESAVNKSKLSIGQLCILGFLSGIYVAFGGALALLVQLGTPAIKAANPALPHIFTGLAFPVALMLIIIAGGELFTGNVMYFVVGMLAKKVTWKDTLINWFFIYFSNYAGCVAGAYFYCYIPNLFDDEPYLSGVQALAVTKTDQDFGVLFLKGMAANQLVDLAIIFCIASQDITGKILSSWFVIGTFAAVGYEHSIANHFYLSLSLMYGSPVGYGYSIHKSMIPVCLGNMTGAAFLVGLALWYVYLCKPGSGVRNTANVAADEVSTQQAVNDARHSQKLTKGSKMNPTKVFRRRKNHANNNTNMPNFSNNISNIPNTIYNNPNNIYNNPTIYNNTNNIPTNNNDNFPLANSNSNISSDSHTHPPAPSSASLPTS